MISEIVDFIQQNIISYLFITTFGLITINRVQETFKIKSFLKIIRFILIGYALLNIIQVIQYLFLDAENTDNQIAFLERASGIYFWIFLLMIVSSCLLSLTLFNNKIGNNKWIILIISFLISFGLFFAKFVIILISLHRGKFQSYYYFNTLTIGVGITLILIGINIWCYFRNRIVDSELIDN